MSQMIELEHLSKHFGPLIAVDDVSFSVSKGEVLGFLGPNGAGKSTTMKMITGFLSPTAGSVRVCGADVVADPIAAKASIGYLPEGAPAYPDMTPRTFLRFVAETRGLGGDERRVAIRDAVGKVHIEDVLEQPIETLSKGYKRRVGLAQAILHDPPVMILDEPTDGLDPNQKFEVRALIKEMARDKAIIISTHILEEVDAVCSRAMIIAKGRVLFDGSPAELEARSRYHNAVTLRTVATGIDDQLAAIAGVGSVERLEGDGYRLFPANGESIVAQVSAQARTAGWPVDGLIVEAGHLDEVFRAVTTGDSQEAAQ